MQTDDIERFSNEHNFIGWTETSAKVSGALPKKNLALGVQCVIRQRHQLFVTHSTTIVNLCNQAEICCVAPYDQNVFPYIWPYL